MVDQPSNAVLAALRREYGEAGLDERSIAPDPIVQFASWLADAVRAGVVEPNAMVLSTVGLDGAPSARTMLLKGVDAGGFTFFTNYGSRKGHELAAVPWAALVFPWVALGRQVSVRGSTERLGDDDSDTYFSSRPRGSQLGAWASRQSQVLADRDTLDARMADVTERFAASAVPRPEHWGGYVLRPLEVEFWQGRPNRLHDRLRYLRRRDGWLIERLSP